MKNIAKLFAAAVLLAGFNSVFADGRKEAVLDMGKGAFTLTVSVPAPVGGPYDFGKNPGIGKAMDGQFQYQEVMFGKNISETTASVFYKVTAKKIDQNKQGDKITPEKMATDQIRANGFEGRAASINCPPMPYDGVKSVCYQMSGDAIFDGKAEARKVAAFLISVSWENNTQGFTFMGKAIEPNVQKFNSEKLVYEKMAKSAAAQLWNNHKIKNN